MPELSKPQDSAIPSCPSLSTTAEGAWLRAELQPWPEGWGRRNMESTGKEVQLYLVPICLPSFPKNKKNKEFLFIYFHFFITQCQAPVSGGSAPFTEKEQRDCQQNYHCLNKIPGIIIASVIGLVLVFVCVWFCSMNM